DVADARPRALVDVVQDAGPAQAPVAVEHPLGAGPRGEGPQQQVEGLPELVGVGVRPEVPGALAPGPALDPGPGNLVGQRHGQPRVRLVVAVADVVAGPVLLDQVVLELQGLDLALHQHPLERRRPLDHGRGPRVQVAHRLEVAGGPLAQRDRLADIDHPPVPVAEQVHAGMVGNRLRLRPRAGRDGHAAILGDDQTDYVEAMRTNYVGAGQTVRAWGTNRTRRPATSRAGSPSGGCARARRLPVPQR